MSITILGSNFGAVTVANILLSEPSLKHLKVTVISPTGNFIGTPAIPRLFAHPELADNVTFSFAEEFQKAFGDRFTHIKGLVTKLDHENKTIYLDNSETESVSYENLVIATGTKKISDKLDLFLSLDEFKKTLENAHDLAVNAKTIAVIGGGATGVETAAELGHYFKKTGQPKDKLVLYSGKNGPMETTFGPSKVAVFKKRLAQKGVTVKQAVAEIPNGPGIESDVTLKFPENGDSEHYDLVISCIGSQPQSNYTTLANEKGFIPTDEYLRAKNAPNVYVVGDLIAGSSRTVVDIVLGQQKIIKATLLHDLGKSSKPHKLVAYKANPQPKAIMICLGDDGGIGMAFGVSLPSFLIKYAKAKSLASPSVKKQWMPVTK